MSTYYKLKNLGELMDSINLCMDVEFYLYGTRYNISWRNDKPFICVCPNGEAVFYDSPNKMFDEYKVKDKTLKEAWKDFDIISM